MTDLSDRHRLPLLVPGQLQKELFHNEALLMIDALLHAAVAGRLAVPPGDPAPGRAWIVDAGATGDWTGQDQRLAVWTAAGWRFLAATEGMTVWDSGARLPLRFADGAWTAAADAETYRIGGQQVIGARRAAVPLPSAGMTVDTEARTAISALRQRLIDHGLIDP